MVSRDLGGGEATLPERLEEVELLRPAGRDRHVGMGHDHLVQPRGARAVRADADEVGRPGSPVRRALRLRPRRPGRLAYLWAYLRCASCYCATGASKTRPAPSVRFRARGRLRSTSPRGGRRGRADRGAPAEARGAASRRRGAVPAELPGPHPGVRCAGATRRPLRRRGERRAVPARRPPDRPPGSRQGRVPGPRPTAPGRSSSTRARTCWATTTSGWWASTWAT